MAGVAFGLAISVVSLGMYWSSCEGTVLSTIDVIDAMVSSDLFVGGGG